MSGPTGQGDARVGRGMLWLAAVVMLGGLTALFALVGGEERGRMASGVDEAGRALVVLESGQGGHYFAEGAINGQAVNFLVDTGATDVALSERAARRMGLDFGPRVTVMTAAGPAPAWITRLDEVQVGALRVNDVRASITPGLGEEALLGMSFLKHFSIRQEGGRLIIAPAGR